jgi:hypothetical protein
MKNQFKFKLLKTRTRTTTQSLYIYDCTPCILQIFQGMPISEELACVYYHGRLLQGNCRFDELEGNKKYSMHLYVSFAP